jgi:hypothetical protein
VLRCMLQVERQVAWHLHLGSLAIAVQRSDEVTGRSGLAFMPQVLQKVLQAGCRRAASYLLTKQHRHNAA